MTGDYCVDANSFITSWNTAYPVNVFPSLWKQIAQHQNDIILIKPVFDEIDPVSSTDRHLNRDQKREKYPLHVWLEENAFTATDITDDIKIISLVLEKEYEINDSPKGVDQNDIALIAYAMYESKTVVTLEAQQPQKPGKKCNYKIPLVCDEQKVECISFITMLDHLGIEI